jgi:hypothetical protein
MTERNFAHQVWGVFEGEKLEIGGFDVWSEDWIDTGEEVTLPDRVHGEPRRLGVYRMKTWRKTVEFAVVELSANVYGFCSDHEITRSGKDGA